MCAQLLSVNPSIQTRIDSQWRVCDWKPMSCLYTPIRNILSTPYTLQGWRVVKYILFNEPLNTFDKRLHPRRIAMRKTKPTSGSLSMSIFITIHTHTHTHIYIYIYRISNELSFITKFITWVGKHDIMRGSAEHNIIFANECNKFSNKWQRIWHFIYYITVKTIGISIFLL